MSSSQYRCVRTAVIGTARTSTNLRKMQNEIKKLLMKLMRCAREQTWTYMCVDACDFPASLVNSFQHKHAETRTERGRCDEVVMIRGVLHDCCYILLLYYHDALHSSTTVSTQPAVCITYIYCDSCHHSLTTSCNSLIKRVKLDVLTGAAFCVTAIRCSRAVIHIHIYIYVDISHKDLGR